MVSIKSFIQDINILEGESLRKDCPFCNGKNTFSISCNDGTILYQCFRLMCTVKGNIYEGMSAQEIKNRLTKLKENSDSSSWEDTCHVNIPMAIPEYIVPISKDKKLINFIKNWGLEDVELLYDVKDRRAVFPIRKDGTIIDAVGRSLVGGIPKWLRYTGAANVYIACQGTPNGVAVIVEDVISANTICSVCQNVTGIAILGTSLSVKHYEYIQEYTKIIVALDPDASHKNLQYRREIVSWTGIDTIAMRLQDDIKYRELEDMTKLKILCG